MRHDAHPWGEAHSGYVVTRDRSEARHTRPGAALTDGANGSRLLAADARGRGDAMDAMRRDHHAWWRVARSQWHPYQSLALNAHLRGDPSPKKPLALRCQQA